MKKRISSKLREKPTSVTAVYAVLSAYTFIVTAVFLIKGDFRKVLGAATTLAFFLLPGLFEKLLKMKFPAMLEIAIVFFIFSGPLLGEIHYLYVRTWYWDKLMHTVSGFIFAAVGYTFFNTQRQEKQLGSSPSLYLAAAAICFSIAIAVLWEFYEFGADRLLSIDMQKDTVINTISSVMLDPTNRNIPIVIKDITDVAVNGESLGFDGYLDIGLYDTMADLLCNTVGAIIFYVTAYIDTKTNKRLLNKVVPVWCDSVAEQ